MPSPDPSAAPINAYVVGFVGDALATVTSIGVLVLVLSVVVVFSLGAVVMAVLWRK